MSQLDVQHWSSILAQRSDLFAPIPIAVYVHGGPVKARPLALKVRPRRDCRDPKAISSCTHVRCTARFAYSVRGREPAQGAHIPSALVAPPEAGAPVAGAPGVPAQIFFSLTGVCWPAHDFEKEMFSVEESRLSSESRPCHQPFGCNSALSTIVTLATT